MLGFVDEGEIEKYRQLQALNNPIDCLRAEINNGVGAISNVGVGFSTPSDSIDNHSGEGSSAGYVADSLLNDGINQDSGIGTISDRVLETPMVTPV